MSNYKYPSHQDLRDDVKHETTAICVAVSAMSDTLEACPLSDNLKVYAALELALKYGREDYVDEVLRELIMVRRMK